MYIHTVLLYVYRLRYRGHRLTPLAMAQEGVRGDVQLLAQASGGSRTPELVAYLLDPGGAGEILPRLEAVRVLRVREAMTITGVEAVPKGRKGVERFRQTWVCSPHRIDADRWRT